MLQIFLGGLKLNKKDVITKISTKTGIKKNVIDVVLSALTETLETELKKGQEINFSGFGKFYTKQRAERKYISFQTGETLTAPAKLVPDLKFSQNFIDKF